ncbi:MAG: hypothetical protein ACLUVV_04665 [Christensenellales bacterium]
MDCGALIHLRRDTSPKRDHIRRERINTTLAPYFGHKTACRENRVGNAMVKKRSPSCWLSVNARHCRLLCLDARAYGPGRKDPDRCHLFLSMILLKPLQAIG